MIISHLKNIIFLEIIFGQALFENFCQNQHARRGLSTYSTLQLVVGICRQRRNGVRAINQEYLKILSH
jgi:hypothetical protein